MPGLDAPVIEARIAIEGLLQASSGIFTEHEVHAVQAGELLLVFAFDCCLHRRLQGGFDQID